MLARILDIVILLTRGLLVLVFVATAALQAAQEPVPAAPKTESSVKVLNFSGTVVEVSDEMLAVERKSLGRDAVKMKFVRDGGTKVEGVLRAKARVTVRYQVFPDGACKAVYIIVR